MRSLSHGERVGVRAYDLSISRNPSPGAMRRPLPMGEVAETQALRFVALSRTSPHQHVPELPRITGIDVLRKQPRPIRQRRPVGIKSLHRAEIRQLDFEA